MTSQELRDVQGWIRCKCGRYADSDAKGQCWICAARARDSIQISYIITGLLFAAISTIYISWTGEQL